MSNTTVDSYKETSCQCLGFNPFDTQQPRDELINNKQAMDEVDDILVKGMKHLSFDELQREQEELHGVSGDIVENPDEIDHQLAELDNRLLHLKPGTEYELAEAMNEDFVKNKAFRLTFLRANRYNPKASADQMIRFFKIKEKLFPMEKLAREITLEDLDEDDIECLLRGSCQISPIKDSSNRTLLLNFPGLRGYKSLDNELRARFYIQMQMIKSLSYPHRGVVIVTYSVGHFRDSMHGSGLIENVNMGMALPFHEAGMHLCIDKNSAEAMILKAAISICSSNVKAKFKIHTGSHLECQYLLSTFGIPPAALPISFLNDDAIRERQLSWYQECLRSEQGPMCNLDVKMNQAVPTENDVLFLGGKTCNNGGNERLRALVANQAETYQAGSAKDKRILMERIMETIQKNGGRFLKPSSDTDDLDWGEVPTSEVRNRISQMFRNLKKRTRASAQKNTPATQEEGLIVEDVFDNDVLFRTKCNHHGNQTLRKLVASRAADYDASQRGGKKIIVDSIVETVKGNGGRFLKRFDDKRWIEVSDNVAGQTVSSHFRNFRKSMMSGSKC